MMNQVESKTPELEETKNYEKASDLSQTIAKGIVGIIIESIISQTPEIGNGRKNNCRFKLFCCCKDYAKLESLLKSCDDIKEESLNEQLKESDEIIVRLILENRKINEYILLEHLINLIQKSEKNMLNVFLNVDTVKQLAQKNADMIIENSNDNKIAKMIKKLIPVKHKIDINAQNNKAFKDVCSKGHIEILKILLKNVNKPLHKDLYNELMKLSIMNGHVDIVLLLLNSKDKNIWMKLDMNLTDFYNNFLVLSCISGNVDMVGLFLAIPFVDPSVNDNLALRKACSHGRDEVVRLLITSDYRVDPSVDNSQIFINACKNNDTEMLEFLLAL